MESDETPFGEFEVVCKVCGSHNIDLENSLGYSEMSGNWGSIELVCCYCGQRSTLYGD